MIRRDTLKKFLAIFISGVTFLNIIGLKNTKIKKPKKPINIKYKTQKEIYNEINEKWIKPSEEKQRQEELKIANEQRSEIQKKEESQWINLICTFYTGSADENGGSKNANKTASGKILSRGMAASNAHKFGTKIYTKEFGTLIIEDTGNPHYIHQVDENTYRIDIYVPDKETAKKLGVIKIKGKIIK